MGIVSKEEKDEGQRVGARAASDTGNDRSGSDTGIVHRGDPSHLAQELAEHLDTLRVSWAEVLAGHPRDMYDMGTLRWIRSMYAYYHAGGKGCPVGRCNTDPASPLPICWTCAGGTGLPPEPESIDLKRNIPLTKMVAEQLGQAAAEDLDKKVTAWHEASSKDDLFGGGDHKPPVVQEVNNPAFAKLVDEMVGLSDKEQQAADIVQDVPEGTLVVRISGIGGCRRAYAYQWQKHPVTNPPRLRWSIAAKMGDAAEPVMVRWLEGQGYVVENALEGQQTVEWRWPKGGLIFRGHPDGNVLGWDGQTRNDTIGEFLDEGNLELKALNTDKAQAIGDQGVQNIVPAYYSQAHGYMRAKGQDATLFVVLDRNTGDIFTEVVPFDKEHWKHLVDRWLEVAPIIVGGELPERDFGERSFECAVCKFKDACWGSK